MWLIYFVFGFVIIGEPGEHLERIKYNSTGYSTRVATATGVDGAGPIRCYIKTHSSIRFDWVNFWWCCEKCYAINDRKRCRRQRVAAERANALNLSKNQLIQCSCSGIFKIARAFDAQSLTWQFTFILSCLAVFFLQFFLLSLSLCVQLSTFFFTARRNDELLLSEMAKMEFLSHNIFISNWWWFILWAVDGRLLQFCICSTSEISKIQFVKRFATSQHKVLP